MRPATDMAAMARRSILMTRTLARFPASYSYGIKLIARSDQTNVCCLGRAAFSPFDNSG